MTDPTLSTPAKGESTANSPMYTPPYPKPRLTKPSIVKRFFLNRKSWLNSYFAKSYTMKMGHIRTPIKSIFYPNQADLVKHILIDNASQYPKSEMLHRMLTPLLGDGIFISNGALWQKQRSMMEAALSQSHVKKVFPLMQQSVAASVKRIQDVISTQSQADISQEMAHVTADIIFRTIYTIPLTQAESQAIFNAFTHYQRITSNFSTALYIGLPQWVLRLFTAQHTKVIRGIIAANIAPRYQQYHSTGIDKHSDILAELLAATDPISGSHFNITELVDQVAVLFLAGHETSASTLSWVFYILANCPHMQTLIRNEIQQILADKPISLINFSDTRRLKHTLNVFKETLRLYPPVGGFMRDATAHECMRDKIIKPKDGIYIVPWLMHRREDVWKNAHSFDPNRFTCPNSKDAIRQYYYPFGAGQRVCIGASFANQEALLIISTLVYHFTFAPLQDTHTRPMPVGHITIKPDRNICLHLTSIV